MVSQRLVLSPLAILLRPGVQKTLEMKKGESILSDSAQGEHQERLLRHIGPRRSEEKSELVFPKTTHGISLSFPYLLSGEESPAAEIR